MNKQLHLLLCGLWIAGAASMPTQAQVAIKFMPTHTAAEQEIAAYLQGRVPQIVSSVNNAIHVNQPINIVIGPSTPGEPDAFYAPDIRMVYIGYRIIGQAAAILDADASNWYRAVEHLLLHELAHALIHVNEINTDDTDTEVAADALAFFILSAIYEPSELLPVVMFFHGLKSTDANSQMATLSPHLPNTVRADDYLCWIIGSEVSLAEQVDADEQGCLDQYEALTDNWSDKLAPYWRSTP